MAVASTNETFTHSLGHRVAGLFNAIGHVFVAIAEASPRMKKLEQLSSMTDEELAAKGMRREDIVKYVFDGKAFL